jgi:hypothetical protein
LRQRPKGFGVKKRDDPLAFLICRRNRRPLSTGDDDAIAYHCGARNVTALTTIAHTLDKLIRRLGSNHDGERLATVHAIDRVLKTAGRDWHDLAAALTGSADDWRAMAQFCRSQAHRLTPREFDFINNIVMRGCEPSEKQWRWLRGIFARLGGET